MEGKKKRGNMREFSLNLISNSFCALTSNFQHEMWKMKTRKLYLQPSKTCPGYCHWKLYELSSDQEKTERGPTLWIKVHNFSTPLQIAAHRQKTCEISVLLTDSTADIKLLSVRSTQRHAVRWLTQVFHFGKCLFQISFKFLIIITFIAAFLKKNFPLRH
jgi:hypothetical protein